MRPVRARTVASRPARSGMPSFNRRKQSQFSGKQRRGGGRATSRARALQSTPWERGEGTGAGTLSPEATRDLFRISPGLAQSRQAAKRKAERKRRKGKAEGNHRECIIIGRESPGADEERGPPSSSPPGRERARPLESEVAGLTAPVSPTRLSARAHALRSGGQSLVVLTPGLLTRRQALPFVGRPLRLPPGSHGNRSGRPTTGSNLKVITADEVLIPLLRINPAMKPFCPPASYRRRIARSIQRNGIRCVCPAPGEKGIRGPGRTFSCTGQAPGRRACNRGHPRSPRPAPTG